MFDNSSPYTLHTEVVEGITHYFVSFKDGQGALQETEISYPVYLEFLSSVKVDRSLRHWDERYREYSELTDETLYSRALNPQKSLEDTAFGNMQSEQLRLTIESLPETQRRRFVLYHEFGFTYEQIANTEGCTKMPIKRSIDRAVKKIRAQIKNI